MVRIKLTLTIKSNKMFPLVALLLENKFLIFFIGFYNLRRNKKMCNLRKNLY